MNIKITSTLICVLSIFLMTMIAGCSKPVDSFDRSNNRDPLNGQFKPDDDHGYIYSNIQDGKLTIEWNFRQVSENIDGYLVEKATNISADTTYDILATLEPNVSRYQDEDINYFNITYRVSPYIESNGELLPIAHTSKTVKRYQPDNIYNRIANEKLLKITIRDFTNPDFIDGYEIEKRIGDGEYMPFKRITDTSRLPEFTIEDTSVVKTLTKYQYRVRSFNEDGKSFFTTGYGESYRIYPPSITGVVPQIKKLQLEYVYTNRIKKIFIERSADSPSNFKEVAAIDAAVSIYDPTTTDIYYWTDNGADTSTTYYYRTKSFGSDYSDPRLVSYEKSLTQKKQFRANTNLVGIPHFLPNSEKFIVIRDREESVRGSHIERWDAYNLTSNIIVSYDTEVKATSIAQNGDYFALTTKNGDVDILETTSGRRFIHNPHPTDSGTDVSIRPEKNQVATGFNSGSIRIHQYNYNSYSQEEAELKYKLSNENGVTHVKYSPNGNYLYAATDDGSIIKYDTRNGYKMVAKSDVHDGQIINFVVSKEGDLLATAGNDNLIKVFHSLDLSQKNMLKYAPFDYRMSPSSLSFYKDNSVLFIGTSTYELLTWNLQRDMITEIKQFREFGADDARSGLAVSNISNQLISYSESNLILWEISGEWILD